MANDKLILRTLSSPYVGDITKGAILSWEDVDGDFLHLKNLAILTATTEDSTLKFTRFDGTILETDISSLVSDSTTTKDIYSQLITDVGAISPNELVPSGTTLTGFIEQLLTKTYYPTFTDARATLSVSMASPVEIGTTAATLTLTAGYVAGLVYGKETGGIWVPGDVQGTRTGFASNFTINGVDRDGISTLNLSNFQVTAATSAMSVVHSWPAIVDYAQSFYLPVNSAGNAVDVNGNPYTVAPAGSAITSTSLTGYRRYFYGCDSTVGVNPYTTSAQIRGLSDSALVPLLPSTGQTVTIPIGTTLVVFAYPKSMGLLTKITHVEDSFKNITSAFEEQGIGTVSVYAANNYSPMDYYLYSFRPPNPFTTLNHYIFIK